MSRNSTRKNNHSDIYNDAHAEFVNCIAMTIMTLGVSLVLAFTEWWPVMNEERRKEKAIAA